MIEITTSACVGGIVTDIFSDGDCGFGRQDLIGRDKAIREAVQFLKISKKYFEDIGDRHEMLLCDLKIGGIYRQKGFIDKAIKIFKSSKRLSMELGLEHELWLCECNIANIYLDEGEYDKSIDVYKNAKKYFTDKSDYITTIICDLNIAAISKENRDYDRAIDIYKRIIKEGTLPDMEWKALCSLGESHLLNGNPQLAIEPLEKATKLIEELWFDVIDEDLRNSFLKTVHMTYYNIICVHLTRKKFKSALEYLERSKNKYLTLLFSARNSISQKKRSIAFKNYQKYTFKIHETLQETKKKKEYKESQYNDIQNWFEEKERIKRSNVITKKDAADEARSYKFKNIQNLIEYEDTAIVELFPTEEHTYAFIVLKKGNIEETTVTISDYNKSNLKNHINGLMKRYLSLRKSRNYRERKKYIQHWEKYLNLILMELYTKLFLRIEKFLNGIRKIIIIPYSGFHIMPLHAMFKEENGQRHYIIDDYQISYTPSAKILEHCNGFKRAKGEKALIVFPEIQENESLHFSEIEAESISKNFQHSMYLTKATKKDFIKYAEDAHFIHYTGHADYNALLLNTNQGTSAKDEYCVKEIFHSLDLKNAYLVTLSACETGLVTDSELDEYIGLPGAILFAGASTVISSLWMVSDISTSLLIRKMYELVKNGNGKAESLQKAQIWIKNPENRIEMTDMLPDWLKESNIELEEVLPTNLSSPYYWAGFICSGAE